MKLLLDCDAVFDALTRGCDAAREDEALREHLECCPECRELANAMEPAVVVFENESRVAERHLTSAVTFANKVFARLDAERSSVLAESHRRCFLYLSAHAWSQLGAAAAVLLALGGLFWATSPRQESTQLAALPAFASPLSRPTEPTEHGLLHLASLQLPSICLTPTAVSQDAAAVIQCCTRCHRSGDMLPAVRLVAFSQQSCVACHKS
ncbi:MAG: hypothetical protein K8R36_11190 [Planctomycetales bacterium]|nr:hypothetical protein [Planctomycetales bacterium]